MSRTWTLHLAGASLCAWLAGCVTLQEPVVNYYGINAVVPAEPQVNVPRAVRVAVQRMEGRAQYQRPRMIVSPSEHVVDSYTSAQWINDPCDMLTDGLVSYLAARCEYVTLHPRVYKDAVNYVITAYLDAFDHVRRGGVWYAQTRIKFDIVDDATRTVLHSDWFERTQPLSDGRVVTYVAAQQAIVNEWYEAVLRALEKAGGTAAQISAAQN